MIDEDFSTALENMSEEEAAELLLQALLENGAPGFITRDENGTLINAKIMNEKGETLFEIKKKGEQE